MKFKLYLSFLLLASCANPRSDSKSQVTTTSDFALDDNVQEVARKELLVSYSVPLLLDTTFVYDNHSYKLYFRHYSANDSGLIIPAKFNFDTRTEFVTHNFKSEIVLVDKNDTIFKREITKHSFKALLNPQLDSFAILLFPNMKVFKDTVEIHYSISIPATDIGIPVVIKFDKKGNSTISD